MVAGGQRVLAVDVTVPPPVQAGDGIDQAGITSITPSMGSPAVGVVFVAPSSGRVRVHVFGGIRLTANAAGAIYLGAIVKTGTTIGSGTLVYDGLNTEPGCRAFYTGYLGYVTAGASSLVEGLTPGASYNASLWHFVTPATTTTGTVMSRQIGVDPLP